MGRGQDGVGGGFGGGKMKCWCRRRCPQKATPLTQPRLEPSQGNQGSETGAAAVEPVWAAGHSYLCQARTELGPFPPPSALSSYLSHKQAPVLLTRGKVTRTFPI